MAEASRLDYNSSKSHQALEFFTNLELVKKILKSKSIENYNFYWIKI